MLQVQHDKLKAKNVKSAVLTTEVETGKKIINKILAVVIKGCTHNEVNGRYIEQGYMNNAPMFVNVNGWSITRQQRQEIPEMDIYASGCYAPATLEDGGQTVSARMNNQTGSALTELMRAKDDGSNYLKDGSAAFKRRFAELARVGNRMIVADHQDDMLHTENIKAENRVQSDEEMLLRISQATQQMQLGGNDFDATLEGVNEGVEEHEDTDDDDLFDYDEVAAALSNYERKDDDSSAASILDDLQSVTGVEDDRIDKNDFHTANTEETAETFGKTPRPRAKTSGKMKATTKKFERISHSKSSDQLKLKKTQQSETTIVNIPTAAEKSAEFLITRETNTGRPVDIYNNLDFKVLTSKNIQSQFGSQGFHNISKKTKDRVEEEADLSVLAVQAIEEREDVLYQLKVEAASVQNKYISSHDINNIDEDEKTLSKLISILNELRNSTIRTAEAIGAWARRASRLQGKERKEKNCLSAEDLNKVNRKYAVVLSIKGAQLYPQSQAMQYTNNRRFRRQLEIAATAVEVKYVGTYDTKDEACKAFVEAAASIPIEQRYAPYVGSAPKMFIGLRKCGNHYLVRSVGVSPDLPCELCGASKASNFKQFIAQATDKLFPQFLFHGENYLDKMWVDTQFLGTVALLQRYFGQFDCFMNPLHLTKDKIAEVMDDIIKYGADLKQDKEGLAGYIDLKPLNNLRGKYERFRVASEDAVRRGKKPKEITIDGIAYRMPGRMPNLNSDLYQPQPEKFMSIDRHYLNQVEAQELKRKLEDETRANISLNLEDYSFGNGQVGVSFSEVSQEVDFKYTTSGEEEKALNDMDLSFSSTFQSRLKEGLSRAGTGEVTARRSVVLEEIDSGAGAVSIQRLQRAMIILGQSQSLNQNFFKAQVVQRSNELPTMGSDGTKSAGLQMHGISAERGMNKRMRSKSAGGTRSKRKRNSEAVVETVVQYTYFGAQLKTVQMRPKVAHRIDNVWVRSDQGEWFGTQTKGRHMKRFDRIERIIQEGKRRQEDRAELSRLITKAVELDFVQGDGEHIKYIRSLLARSAKHKGSVLDLDVIKAEKYIRDRKIFIESVRFVQRCYRGYDGRVYASQLREARRIHRLKTVLRDQEIAKLARCFVPDLLSRVVKSQAKILGSKQFQIASNFGGIPMIVSVYAKPRGIRRNQNLCLGCQMRSQHIAYDPSKRKKWNDQSPCYVSERFPCSCIMVRGQERWLLEVYDPVSSKKYFKEYTAQQIQHYVFRSYYESRKLSDMKYHKHMLFGKDFGVMKSLFAPDDKSQFGSAYYESEGKFRMDASREYAVLGQIPRSYSEHIMYGMTHYKLTPELANIYSSHLLQKIRRPIIVENIERNSGKFLEDDCPDEVAWQPIEDVLYARHQFEHIKLIAPAMEVYMFKTRVEWEESRDLLYNHLVGQYEQSSMEYEDIRSRFVTDEDNLRKAEEVVKTVMEFSLSGLEKIEAEERGEREDWNQAWEGLEDGNRWKNLNNARKFKEKLRKTINEFDEMVKTHQGVLDYHAHLVSEEARRHKLVSGDRSKIEALNLFVSQTQDCVLSIRKIALETLKVLVSGLIIPSRLTLESHKKLKYPTTHLPYIREPSKRGQVDFRAGWDVIARRFMKLKPLDEVGIHHLRRNKKEKQEAVRCVVTIYKDTLFDNYIVNIRTSDDKQISTEENAMHEDFLRQKTDYSLFTMHAECNEIMISKKYIEDVLFAKPFNWPENRLGDRILEERVFFSTKQEENVISADVKHNQSGIGSIETFDVGDNSVSRPSSRGGSRRSSRNSSRPSTRTSTRPSSRLASRPSSRQTIIGSRRSTARTTPPTARLKSPSQSRPGSASHRDSDTDNAMNAINSSVKEHKHNPSLNNESENKEIEVIPLSDLLKADVDVEDDGDDNGDNGDDMKVGDNRATVFVKAIVYNRLACRSVPKGGYHARHMRQRTEQEAIIEKLIKYIRLNPHSLRPCLGLLPFHRRRDNVQTVADKTLWYQDMIRKTNSSWLYSEFCKDKASVVCQREFVATLRDCYGEIALRLRTPFGGKEFGAFESEVVIPFEDILKSMMTKPVLLGAFLCETITNCYSDDFIRHVLGNIDLSLPGENGRWWRKVFIKEKTPSIAFIADESEKYRGPIFRVNKFVSGKYCQVKVYMSATFDLKIEFSPPDDGLFWFQSLKSCNALTALLSHDAIKTFLLKKYLSPRISEAEKEWILKLYHPNYLHELIHFILKNIELKNKVILKKYFFEDDSGNELPFISAYRNNERVNEADSDGESEASGSPSLNAFDIGDSVCNSDMYDFDSDGEEETPRNHDAEKVMDEDMTLVNDSKANHDRRLVEMNWRQRLRVKLWKCIKKFNKWINRFNINITPLSSKTIAEIYTNLKDYDSPPEWALQSIDNGGEMKDKLITLVVYDGFWATVDPRLIIRKPIQVDSDYLALNAASVFSKSLVEDPNTGFNNYRKPAPEIIFQGEAYYRVRVETDSFKSQVNVTVHQTEVTDPSAETEVHRMEWRMMEQEDEASRKSATLEIEMMMLREASSIRAATPIIPSDYVEHLIKVRDRNDALKQDLRRVQREFLPLIDGIWDKVALNSYALCANTLAVSFDENKKQVFHVDNEAIGEKCKKFARFSLKDPNVTPTLSCFDSIKPSSARRAERKALKAGKVEKSVAEVATENERITEQMKTWLGKLLTELRDTKDIIPQPTMAFQQFGVSTKAYPGLGAPRAASAVDGLTSADGVYDVMSYSPTPFYENTFRTNVSWRRVRPLRDWELGNLVSLDKDYLRRARKGTKPHYLRYKGTVFMVSAPNIGPADRSSVSIYSPATGDSVVVGFQSNIKIPFIRGLKYYSDRDVYEEGEGSDVDSVSKKDSITANSNDESDLNIESESDEDESDDIFPFEYGILRITKIETFNLRSVAMVGKNDPIVSLQYGSILATQTPVVKGGGSDVTWEVNPDSEKAATGKDESPLGHMNFQVTPLDLKSLELEVEVMNVNKLSKPSVIGTGKVSLGAYLTSKRWEDKVAVISLIDSKYRDCGEVHVHFEFIEKHAPPVSDQSPALVIAKEAAERIVWRSMVNGITFAAVKAAESKIDEVYLELEKQVAQKCAPWYRHQHLITLIDKAGNLEYSSVLVKKRTEEEKNKLLDDPKKRHLVPSTAITTKSRHLDCHLRKLIMKKFEPKNFQRKVSLMYIARVPEIPPNVRNANTMLYGLFVPADEDIFPEPFVATCPRQWQSKCYEHLNSTTCDPPTKIYTFPAIVYCSDQSMTTSGDEKKVINLKLGKFVFEYSVQLGWRKENAYFTHKRRLLHEKSHRNNFGETEDSPTIYGDVVILMRHGEADFHLMQQWCKQRHIERLELIEKRRLKELHEHQMRINKFKEWRSDIYCIAAKYGTLFEKYFYRDYKMIKFIPEDGAFNSGFERTENGEYQLNSYVGKIVHKRDYFSVYNEIEWRHLRLLFLRYTELLKSHPKEMKHSIQMMDQDYAFAIKEREFFFESYSRSDFISGEEFLKFQWNTFDNPRNLQYQTGHILYALYLNHCEHCCVIPGTCPIPGCNIIRQWAHGQSYEYGLYHNSDAENDYRKLRGSGYHPLELSTKRYLLEKTTFEKHFVFPTLRSKVNDVICSEVTSECSDLTRKELEKKSRAWRKQISEARKFRYLNRRVIKPSLRSYLTAEEVHEAKGGHDDREEKQMSDSDSLKLSFYLPSPSESVTMDSAFLFEEESTAIVQNTQSTLQTASASLAVSTEAMKRMMGIHDGNICCHDVCSYDPAPSREDLVRSWNREGLTADEIANNKNCMSNELFQWILQRMRLQRDVPIHDPAESLLGIGNSDLATAFDYYVSKLNDSTMLHSEEQKLMFDRQLVYGVTRSMDNELMFLQILQGILPRAGKRHNSASGRPDAAKRFANGEEMSALVDGLTLSVHHIDSDTTIALVIEERKLDIVADTFKVPRKNCPLIAKALYANAAETLKLHLTDGMCKDVTLSIKLKEDDDKKSVLLKTPLQDQFKHTSRRNCRVNKQKGRLGAAALLLDVLDTEHED